MENYNILKDAKKWTETYYALPKKVRIAFIEIELYEKNRMEVLETGKKQQEAGNYEISKYLLKDTIEQIGDITINNFVSSSYLKLVSQVIIKVPITPIMLYQSYSDDLLFTYICYKLQNIGRIDYDLLLAFKNYMLHDDYKNLLIKLFNPAETDKIMTQDFYKNGILEPNIILLKDKTYYKIHSRNSNVLVISKLMPKVYENFVIYNINNSEQLTTLYTFDMERIHPINYRSYHIKIPNNIFFVFN